MDEYRVDTPENIAFSYDISGIGSRFLAALIDTAILALLLFAALLTATAVISTSAGQEWLGQFAQSVIVAGFVLLTFSIYWSYYIFFELIWNGQSPGKRITGLRVIRTDGTPVTVVDSIVRNIVRLVDFMPTFYGAGIIVMLINSQSRRLGDLAAGTVVIKERREVTLAHLAQSAAQVAASQPTPLPAEAVTWPIERLTEDDYYIVNEFFARRAQIANAGSLARRLATALHARLDLPLTQPLTTGEALDFMNKIADVYRALGSGKASGRVSTLAGLTDAASRSAGETRSSEIALSCPRCGVEVMDSVETCPSCGLDLSGRCPRCRAPLPDGADACSGCGQAVCPACGSAVGDNAAVCAVCGTQFRLSCPRCGATVASQDVVCPRCGETFTEL